MTTWRNAGPERQRRRGAATPPAPSDPRHREYRLRRRKRGREDHLDVIGEQLGIHRCRALVLAVDEPGRAIGHDMAGEGRALQRRDDLGALSTPGTLDRIGEQENA